jgi:hypothetical protein
MFDLMMLSFVRAVVLITSYYVKRYRTGKVQILAPARCVHSF